MPEYPYTEEQLQKIWDKTNGKCHLCGQRHLMNAYARKGGWEVDHSKPKAKGGTDHLNNLYLACMSCNRGKRDRHSSQEVRLQKGTLEVLKRKSWLRDNGLEAEIGLETETDATT